MSLILLGYMGSGKTSLCKRLSNRLKLPRYDLDAEIERLANASVSEIFEKSGESVFRDIECHTLERMLGKGDMVLSLGGGTPCFKDNMSLIKENTFSVYLKMNPKVAFKRLRSAKSSRPLIEGKDDDELLSFIEKQMGEREEYYGQADLIVDADKISAITLDEIKLHYLQWYAGRIHDK